MAYYIVVKPMQTAGAGILWRKEFNKIYPVGTIIKLIPESNSALADFKVVHSKKNWSYTNKWVKQYLQLLPEE